MNALLPLWAWVAAGSAAGGVARFAVTRLWPWMPGTWPLATMSVNLAGSLLIGVLSVLFAARLQDGALEAARAFWMTGVLGGFTTYSAFALEAAVLAGEGAIARSLAYALVTVAGCIAAALIGRALGLALIGE